MTLREQILAVQDLPEKDIQVPAWGNLTIRIRGMPIEDAIAFQEALGGDDSLRAVGNMLAKCILDPETGEPVFADSSELFRKSLRSVRWIAEQISGINTDPLEEAKSNLADTPDSDSTPN